MQMIIPNIYFPKNAKQLGKDQATVSKWCTNTSQPSLETLFQIAECLGVKVQDLISKDTSKDHE